MDERRIDNRKICPCVKPLPKKWTPNKFSQNDFGKKFFDKYFAKYLLKLPVKLTVVACTLAMFAVGVYGTVNLVPDYNAVWYMRERSYQKRFFESSWEYFPENGERVQVYVGQVKLWENLDQLRQMDEVLRTSGSVNNDSIINWFPEFYKEWCVVSPELANGLSEEDLAFLQAGMNCSDGRQPLNAMKHN